MKVTLEDAIEALKTLPASPAVDRIQDFFEMLGKKVTPVVITSDYEGFILDGAGQQGFDHIDDDASLYIVGANDLIAYAKIQRANTTVEAARSQSRYNILLSSLKRPNNIA